MNGRMKTLPNPSPRKVEASKERRHFYEREIGNTEGEPCDVCGWGGARVFSNYVEGGGFWHSIRWIGCLAHTRYNVWRKIDCRYKSCPFNKRQADE